ncbi:hypothetical protein CY34DRAFT_812660 [Suillus luteus UH-Slu-Lm8-n1]|uniref:Uncharacterized protein n=1 Tax=Suillus luteus UH-Slu-Lm8-n1 TaxID=930992 RepID=A0A0D0A9G6_9AGAM|nr:hypothetical protein CY34DRAFT_812660 [Suillus luteus UH-Slu-Lm8-n1]
MEPTRRLVRAVTVRTFRSLTSLRISNAVQDVLANDLKHSSWVSNLDAISTGVSSIIYGLQLRS